jgi:hypothetical protein
MALITANRFNTLRQQVENVLGTGSGDTGYGQSLVAQPVTVGQLINAVNINSVYEDLRKCYKHQTGGNPASSIIKAVTQGELIKDDDNVTYTGWDQYEALATLVSTNRLTAHPNQIEDAVAFSKTRGSWNASIALITDVSFASAEAARLFFNQGGYIRVAASVAGTTSKDTSWQSILSGAGNVDLKAHATTQSGASGTVSSAVGFFELTDTYQYIYQNFNAGATPYAANDYYIEALIDGTTIKIRQTFDDQAAGNIDEAVSDATATIITGTAIIDVIGTAPGVTEGSGTTF